MLFYLHPGSNMPIECNIVSSPYPNQSKIVSRIKRKFYDAIFLYTVIKQMIVKNRIQQIRLSAPANAGNNDVTILTFQQESNIIKTPQRKKVDLMKKLGEIFILTAMLLLCAALMTIGTNAIFPGLSGFPSTVSGGNVWLIVGIAVVVIVVAVILIVKKAKASKKKDNEEK